MKITKTLMIAALVTGLTFTASQAQAACDGGITVDKFCISDNIQMNWWSAYSWCEAQGMKLASAYDLCPTWSGAIGDNKCGTKISSAHRILWTSTAKGNNEAIAYYGNVGDMNNYPRTRGWYAACIAK